MTERENEGETESYRKEETGEHGRRLWRKVAATNGGEGALAKGQNGFPRARGNSGWLRLGNGGGGMLAAATLAASGARL